MGRTLDAWRKDFLHAARGLLRAPGFTAVTAATLALAIGSVTAIFSVVDAVLIDPLPFPEADRLVSIRASAPGTDMPQEFGVGTEFYVQYSEESDRLEDLGFFNLFQTTMRTEERTDRLFMQAVNPSFFSTLGVTPIVGRLPTEQDDEGQVVVISHRLWTSWFGGDPAVIGRSYFISGAQRTVLGVMPAEFRFLDARVEVWIHDLVTDRENLTPRGFGLGLVGRMTPGTTHEELTAQLGILARRLPERFGGSDRYRSIIERHQPVVRSLEEQLVGDLAAPLWLLLGTVGIVLLIACANVANLFIVRAESRRLDLAVRRALGAGRARLVRTQMAEALLLALLGGAAGAVLAWAGVPALVRAAPEGLPNLDTVGLNANVLIFTAGVSIVAACAFGLLPAIRFSNPGLTGGLRQAGRIGDSRGRLARHALVVVQTAAALVLLVGAGLLMRSFWELTRVDPGYDTRDIFTFQIAPDRDELNDGPSYARFHETFMERVAALPGVESVGLTMWLPLDEGAGTSRFATERTQSAGAEPHRLSFSFVGGDYFRTMGIELLQGRAFEAADHSTGLSHIVVSRSAADLLWPGADPIGQRIRLESDTLHWYTTVGVVEDILLEDFRQESPDLMIYAPMVGPEPDTWAVGSPAYVVKTPRAGSIAPEVRQLVRELAPESPMYRIFTMEGLAERSMAALSFTMLMLAIAAALALTLGAVGLYGVLSYVVSQRRREIAVRMALGAEAPEVQRMVIVQGSRVALIGIALGVLAALGATRALESLLFGVGTVDFPVFAGLSIMMLAVAGLASYVPARRASSVDPMESLRTE